MIILVWYFLKTLKFCNWEKGVTTLHQESVSLDLELIICVVAVSELPRLSHNACCKLQPLHELLVPCVVF